jgi:hypothetical protein
VSTVNGLAVRKRLGRDYWSAPDPFGSDGWRFDSLQWTKERGAGRIIVTASEFTKVGAPAGQEWLHASISWTKQMPSYEDLTRLHAAVWPEGYAYQVFAPPSQHVNLHAYALHLWGLADGSPILPEFGKFGTI